MIQHKSKFTLLELLVVVAIIAILAAILLPALLRVKHKARIVLCLGNLKQQGIGAIMYVDDHGGRIQNLPSHHPNQAVRPDIDNREYLLKITSNTPEILYCPLAETFTMDSYKGWNNADRDEWAFMSYNIVGFYDDSLEDRPHFYLNDIFDYQINTDAGRHTTNLPTMIDAISDPSDTGLSVDAQASWKGAWPGNGDYPPGWDGWEDYFAHRWGGKWEGASAVYFDGHAAHGFSVDMVDYDDDNWGARYKMNYEDSATNGIGHYMWWP